MICLRYIGGDITKKQLVAVEWGDAHAGSRWVEKGNMDSLHSPLVVTWVGFVVKKDDTGITLSFGFDENDNYAGNMFIPAGIIRKIRKIKY